MQHQKTRKRGFTLVEIIVVLAIAALLSSIVFAAFKSVNEGNKKTSCQTNLVQIYQALRLYGQDFNGDFPSYNPAGIVKGETSNPRAPEGLGLWALYAYPASDKLDCDGRTTQLPATEASDNQTPLASYIKSPNSFHCPYDDFDKPIVTASTECRVTSGTTTLNSSQLEFKDASGVSYFNPFYNSYQTLDKKESETLVPLNQAPYSSFREPNASRQLVNYKSNAAPSVINPEVRTPDTTVITWCRFHRKTDRDGNTVDKASNSDNVLFMDGTVRYLPTTQKIGAFDCEGWKRIPEETIEGYNSTTPAPTGCPQ